MSELDQDALRRVALGMDIEHFLQGPVGLYIVGRAEQQRAEALDKLAEADPEDPKAIRSIQNQIAIIDSIQQWIADALTDAEQAEKQLHEEMD